MNRQAFRLTSQSSRIVLVALTLSTTFSFAQTPKLEGRWAATLTTKSGIEIPFRLDISGGGDHLTGTLFSGQNIQSTTSAHVDGDKVLLNFEHYLTRIEATIKKGELDGQVVAQHRSPINITPGTYYSQATDSVSAFHAKRYVPTARVAATNVPSINGEWVLPHESPKGEKAWRLIVKQSGAEIEASVLRVDGDTGALVGEWQNGKFVASHFDGSRPGLIEITPQSDGSLQVALKSEQPQDTLVAYRPEVARSKGLAEPTNYLTHTTVRNPDEVFSYSFPDLDGNTVSNNDAKFKGKVVLAIVTGTWCPNCHDEAQYLVKLYEKYRDRGLEIVALDFEEADQKESLQRVKAFVKKYKVPYTYLIVGTPDEMWAKVPQAVNLNTWPATFFIGRDGKVKGTYSGFATSASGAHHEALKKEFTSLIDRLLDGKESLPAVSSAAGIE